MVGRYLATLTPVEEHRVLTRQMLPIFSEAWAEAGGACGCLMMTAQNVNRWLDVRGDEEPGQRYEDLGIRFGHERVNRLIRNRILSNQARRALREVRAYAGTME